MIILGDLNSYNPDTYKLLAKNNVRENITDNVRKNITDKSLDELGWLYDRFSEVRKFPSRVAWPYNAFDMCGKSGDFHGEHLNAHQLIESLYLLPVCHAFANCTPDLLTFATPYYVQMDKIDHTPLVVTVMTNTGSTRKLHNEKTVSLKTALKQIQLPSLAGLDYPTFYSAYQKRTDSYNHMVTQYVQKVKEFGVHARVYLFFNISEDAIQDGDRKIEGNQEALQKMLGDLDPHYFFCTESFVPDEVVESKPENGIPFLLKDYEDATCQQRWAGRNRDESINVGKAQFEVVKKYAKDMHTQIQVIEDTGDTGVGSERVVEHMYNSTSPFAPLIDGAVYSPVQAFYTVKGDRDATQALRRQLQKLKVPNGDIDVIFGEIPSELPSANLSFTENQRTAFQYYLDMKTLTKDENTDRIQEFLKTKVDEYSTPQKWIGSLLPADKGWTHGYIGRPVHSPWGENEGLIAFSKGGPEKAPQIENVELGGWNNVCWPGRQWSSYEAGNQIHCGLLDESRNALILTDEIGGIGGVKLHMAITQLEVGSGRFVVEKELGRDELEQLKKEDYPTQCTVRNEQMTELLSKLNESGRLTA